MYDDDGTDAICYFVITIPDIAHDNMEEEGSEGARLPTDVRSPNILNQIHDREISGLG